MVSIFIVIIFLTGIGFLAFGVAYALWPSRMASVTDVALPTASARTDFAATYGGFQIGFGLFLLACARTPALYPAGLWAGIAALGGFAAVRTVGIFVAERRVKQAIWFGLWLEILGLIINLWGLQQLGLRASAA
jgi:hypothetical protein